MSGGDDSNGPDQTEEIVIEPHGERWKMTRSDGSQKRFDKRGDAEARAVAWARAMQGAEIVLKDPTGGIERSRLVDPD